jgi:hypothetical protein
MPESLYTASMSNKIISFFLLLVEILGNTEMSKE